MAIEGNPQPIKLKVKARRSKTPVFEEPTPQDNATLLSNLGQGSLSALHTVGSVLSAPSRWTWGTLNGMFGGEGGYGNMSLTDSTNGIELSHVLGNLGVIAKNDPNKWEWMDPVRGLIDIAGDPTTYINPLTYTTKGLNALKAAGKAKPVVQAAAKAAPDVVETAAKAAASAAPEIVPEVAQAAAKAAPFSAYKAATELVPGAVNSELVPFRDLMKATGKTPDEIMESLSKEIPGGYSLHRHDFPGQIIHEGKQGEFFWKPKDPGDIGSYDKPFIGFSLRKGVVPGAAEEAADAGSLLGKVRNEAGWQGDNIFKSQREAEAAAAAQRAAQEAEQAAARGESNFDDIFRAADESAEAAANAKAGYQHPANRSGLDPMQALSREEILSAAKHPFSDMPLVQQIHEGYRGLGGVQLPFMDPLYEGWTGPAAAAFAKKTRVPQLLDRIGKTGAARALSGLFDAHTRNVVHQDLQDPIIKASENWLARNQIDLQNSLFDLEDMHRRGLTTKNAEAQLRMALENVDPKLATATGEYDPAVREIASRMKAEIKQRAATGVNRNEFSERIDQITGNEYAPRQIHPDAGESSGGKGSRKPFLEGHKRGTVGIEEMVTDPVIRNHLMKGLESGEAPKETMRKMAGYIQEMYGEGKRQMKTFIDPITGLESRKMEIVRPGTKQYAEKYTTLMGKSKSRIGKLVKYLYENPSVTEHGLFTNHPVYDLLSYQQKRNFREEMIPATLDALQNHIQRLKPEGLKAARKSGKDVVPLKAFAKTLGIHHGKAEYFYNEMARRTGLGESQLRNLPIDRELHTQVKNRVLRSPIQQEAVPEASNFFKSLMTAWKARTLAHPSTRARDYLSALAQNVLMKHRTSEGSAMAKDLLAGKQVAGLGEDPLVAMQLRRAGMEATPETETMALRAALGAGHPVNHGTIGDIPGEQLGVTAGDMLQNSPGHTPRSWGKFGSDIKQIATGHTFNSTTGEWEGTPWRHLLNPFAARSAFGYEKSMNPRYVLSEYLAHHGDQSTRLSSTLGQATQGLPLAEAIRRSNSSLVNYDPNLYSNFERQLRSYAIPFWSFTSRMGKHTLGELASNPGGLTAQMVKASGRASQGDPSAPDEVNSSAAIPFKWPWLKEDGSKNYLSGFGLMHEDPINKLGHFLTGDIRQGLRGAAGSVGPLLKPLIEQATGKSLFTGGDVDALDPSLGRTLSNIGYMAGLYRDEGGKPKDWEDVRPVGLPPGVEAAIGYSPFARDFSTARMLSDVRPSKSVVDKLLQLGTGYRTTSVTPERQQKVLRQRLEKAAKGLGAREISNVSFTKEQMESIRKRDPETADNLEHLQAIIRAINKANRDKKKAKAAG